MAYENVRLTKEGGIGTVTIARPKVLNALNDATLHAPTRSTTAVTTPTCAASS